MQHLSQLVELNRQEQCSSEHRQRPVVDMMLGHVAALVHVGSVDLEGRATYCENALIFFDKRIYWLLQLVPNADSDCQGSFKSVNVPNWSV